jgi:hypothetical protein
MKIPSLILVITLVIFVSSKLQKNQEFLGKNQLGENSTTGTEFKESVTFGEASVSRLSDDFVNYFSFRKQE